MVQFGFQNLIDFGTLTLASVPFSVGDSPGSQWDIPHLELFGERVGKLGSNVGYCFINLAVSVICIPRRNSEKTVDYF